MKKFFILLCFIFSGYVFAEVAYVNYQDNNLQEVADGDLADKSNSDLNDKGAYKEELEDRSIDKSEKNIQSKKDISSDVKKNNIDGIYNKTRFSPRTLNNSSSRSAIIRSGGAQIVSRENLNNSRGVRSRSVLGGSVTTSDTNRPNVRTRDNKVINTARAGTLYNPRVSTSGNNYIVGVRSSSSYSGGSTSVSGQKSTPKVQERVEYVPTTQVTEECKAEYQSCMDDFCATLDDNQGRCSCSDKVKEYADNENSLKKATEELKELIQKIKYIGLSKEDVQSLFQQTEGELALQGKSDTSALKTELDRIKGMILNVDDSTDSNANSDGLLDITELLNGGNDNNVTDFDFESLLGGKKTSVARQRGAKLRNTASSKCETQVLKSCRSKGADIKAVIAGYDLDIEKQCITYEKSLTAANDKMKSTIRNAQYFLQKARLVVAKQRNTYEDTRTCVNALDKCMQDDFVCGDGYKNCLDPTGKYIYNGKALAGTSRTNISNLWDYKGSNIWTSGDLSDYIQNTLFKYAQPSNSGDMYGSIQQKDNSVNGKDISTFLQYKIGYKNADGKNTGFCMSVLDKCQDSSYLKGKYNPSNEVVRTFLQRALVQIHGKHEDIIQKLPISCLEEVKTCLEKNLYDVSKNITCTGDACNNSNSTTDLKINDTETIKVAQCDITEGYANVDIIESCKEKIEKCVGNSITEKYKSLRDNIPSSKPENISKANNCLMYNYYKLIKTNIK